MYAPSQLRDSSTLRGDKGWSAFSFGPRCHNRHGRCSQGTMPSLFASIDWCAVISLGIAAAIAAAVLTVG